MTAYGCNYLKQGVMRYFRLHQKARYILQDGENLSEDVGWKSSQSILGFNQQEPSKLDLLVGQYIEDHLQIYNTRPSAPSGRLVLGGGD